MNEVTLKLALRREAAAREMRHITRVLSEHGSARFAKLHRANVVTLRLRGHAVSQSGAFVQVGQAV